MNGAIVYPYADRHEHSGVGHPPKYPFRKLAVGESFFVPGIHINEICKRTYHFKPMRFSSRTVVWNGMQGVRVRRVK